MLLCSINLFAQTIYPFQVEKSGKGEQTIILIPGFASSGDVWDSTLKLLEDEFSCHTLTMAGFAGVPPEDSITFNYWTTDIANYIIQNNIEQPIIIGHSMGGGLAMNIASEYPDLIKQIVVVDALPCLSAMMNPNFKSKENNDCSTMEQQITSMSDESFRTMQKNNLAAICSDTSMHETIIEWSIKTDRKTYANMYCDFSNTDLRAKIESIKCPALILLESYFKNFKPQIEAQFKNLKTANLQYADKGLHFIMFDDQEWYEQQIKQNIVDK